MELKHIDIACLSVSPANMRGVKKQPDLTNILPSVRARGILVPLIVRAGSCPEPVEGGSPTTYEIVAGKRRYHAALAVAQESGGIDPLPCAVMEAGDDAAALEASLIENIARLDPDEVTRWESFTRLVKEGRSPEDIALTFGLTSLQVKRTLALGNLLPRIRTLYRNGAIDAVTVRHLTLASRPRQREWLALLDDGNSYAPTGHALKSWLMGGHAIATSKALFDLSLYTGEIVADLFGEDSYFADATQFWQAQEDAIAALMEDYREAGWTDVLVLPKGETFHHWEHVHCPKKKGGRIYIAVGHGGDVAVHEGYISQKEARRLERGDVLDKPVRPELSAPLTSYVDLHRHAAVRAKLACAPAMALRVMVSATRTVLPAIIPAFLAAYPDIRVEIVAEESFVDILVSGCDAGIRYEERLAQDMIAVPIGPRTQRFALGASAHYLARRGTPQHPRELLDHACIQGKFPSGAVFSWDFERDGEQLRIEPNGPLIVQAGAAMELAIDAAIAGSGIVALFEDWLLPHFASGALQTVLEPWWVSFSGPFLYYPGRRLVPAPLRVFVDFIRTHPHQRV